VRFSPRAIILLYHRIRPGSSCDPYALGVTPEHFAEHLQLLRKHGRPMGLQQLVEALRYGNLPRRAVVVTFDDGYADNLNLARPLLERHDVPATVFVTAGYLGQGCEFWWDELDRLLLQPGTLPELLRLEINGIRHQWELGSVTSYDDSASRTHCNWHYAMTTDPTPRHQIFRVLYRELLVMPHQQRRSTLESLRTWAGAEATARASHRILSQEEVVRLAEGGLVEIGAHTMTHPVLGSLSRAGQAEEIRGSKDQLEDILGHTVTSFAYPYGTRARNDYTPETVELVRDAGFACGCSNLATPVHQGSDTYQLSRATVKDWDGERLAERLQAWFCA
jgi:peptidoglycan/xylan/chitin deacetylase (PgdA/CDA1 family)